MHLLARLSARGIDVTIAPEPSKSSPRRSCLGQVWSSSWLTLSPNQRAPWPLRRLSRRLRRRSPSPKACKAKACKGMLKPCPPAWSVVMASRALVITIAPPARIRVQAKPRATTTQPRLSWSQPAFAASLPTAAQPRPPLTRTGRRRDAFLSNTSRRDAAISRGRRPPAAPSSTRARRAAACRMV